MENAKKKERVMGSNEFSLLLQDVVLRDAGGMRNVAFKLGKTQASLLRELNPHDRRAKLGVETLLRLMEVCHDVRPLEYMAGKLGMRLEMLPKGEERGN